MYADVGLLSAVLFANSVSVRSLMSPAHVTLTVQKTAPTIIISNHLQMPLQRQHVLLGNFKTLSIGMLMGRKPLTSRIAARRSPY